MNYYIQGDAANADKIKAAFENKGYSDKGFTFDVNDILFFTANNKHINVCPANGWLANIIKTHPDYKELELPVEPNFKVGDWVAGIDDDGDMATEKKELRKIKPHYDIANFHAGMPVLQRSGNDEHWDYDIFSRYLDNNCSHPFILVGCYSRQCIPFNDDTKHLLGTTDMPREEYINW